MKIELSHDLLAKKIHEKASTEDKMILRIRKFIQERFEHFNENKTLLSFKDINYISPYLDKLNLEPYEKRFIQRSQAQFYSIVGIIVFITLFMIGVVVFFIHRENKKELQNQERMEKQLARYQQMTKHAEELSNALTASRKGLDATKEELHLALLALQERNDILVDSYATYKVYQNYSEEQLEKDLHIAQSAKLSDLATSLLSSDKGYAFQLATKAWQLNPENQEAMAALYQLATIANNGSYSKQKTYTIIKQYAKQWGALKDKDMNAIFQPQNSLAMQRERATSATQIPPPSSQVPQFPQIEKNTNEVHKKIEFERQKIKQRIENMRLKQEEMRNKMLKSPQ